eukprot:SAG11_NODE_218_length_12212_cov_7.026005_10_plen_211_part_00
MTLYTVDVPTRSTFFYRSCTGPPVQKKIHKAQLRFMLHKADVPCTCTAAACAALRARARLQCLPAAAAAVAIMMGKLGRILGPRPRVPMWRCLLLQLLAISAARAAAAALTRGLRPPAPPPPLLGKTLSGSTAAASFPSAIHVMCETEKVKCPPVNEGNATHPKFIAAQCTVPPWTCPQLQVQTISSSRSPPSESLSSWTSPQAVNTSHC